MGPSLFPRLPGLLGAVIALTLTRGLARVPAAVSTPGPCPGTWRRPPRPPPAPQRPPARRCPSSAWAAAFTCEQRSGSAPALPRQPAVHPGAKAPPAPNTNLPALLSLWPQCGQQHSQLFFNPHLLDILSTSQLPPLQSFHSTDLRALPLTANKMPQTPKGWKAPTTTC